MEMAEVRQIVEKLIGPVWTFSALCYAVEKGFWNNSMSPER
jgi:hypothetical protein